eukprot:GEZU01014688.1.p1 GENE.GEZU01014688.1~~GEZU01014688.1.p1  ORF type:complete len:147 (-),score=25.81 GEZU01014688.1:57-497(-)
MAFKLKRSLLLPLLLFTSAVSCATLALFVASEQKNDQFISDGDTESAPRDLWTITEIIFGTGAGMFVLWPLISLWTIFKHIPGAAWTALNILWGIGTLVLLVGGIGLMIAELASKQNQGEWWALLFTGLAGFLMTLVSSRCATLLQ